MFVFVFVMVFYPWPTTIFIVLFSSRIKCYAFLLIPKRLQSTIHSLHLCTHILRVVVFVAIMSFEYCLYWRILIANAFIVAIWHGLFMQCAFIRGQIKPFRHLIHKAPYTHFMSLNYEIFIANLFVWRTNVLLCICTIDVNFHTKWNRQCELGVSKKKISLKASAWCKSLEIFLKWSLKLFQLWFTNCFNIVWNKNFLLFGVSIIDSFWI